jgi:cytochrome c oxidase cbb3-type subunit I/II
LFLLPLRSPSELTQGKEYAELEWPIDYRHYAIDLGCLCALNCLRHDSQRGVVSAIIYVATLVLHCDHYHGGCASHRELDSQCRLRSGKATRSTLGVQDALVQWWYGHNAVAFFLTTPFLGLMYLLSSRRRAERPIYSATDSRLSISGRSSFLYIWAGPHHLLYTALPDWAQTLGVVFSVMLMGTIAGEA